MKVVALRIHTHGAAGDGVVVGVRVFDKLHRRMHAVVPVAVLPFLCGMVAAALNPQQTEVVDTGGGGTTVTVDVAVQ
jgi:hypothetical protein